MILSNNEDILNAYQLYLKEGTKLTLASDLLNLLRLQSNTILNLEDNEIEEEGSNDSHRVKRALSVKIPARNIQKVPQFTRIT